MVDDRSTGSGQTPQDAAPLEQALADSRRRLDAALVAGEIGTWVYELRVDRVFADSNLLKIFALSASPREVIAGLPLLQFMEKIHPDDRTDVARQIAEAIASQSTFYSQYRITNPAGDRWVVARGTVERDEHGVAVRLPGVVLDVTERKRAEHAERDLDRRLNEQARLYDALLNSISDPAYIFDLQGRCLFANKPLLALWRRTLDQAVGKSWAELNYEPTLIRQLMTDIGRVAETGQSVRGDVDAYASPDGSTGAFEHVFSPVFGDAGEVVAVAGSSRDITARKRAEVELTAVAHQRDALLGLQRAVAAAAETGGGDASAAVMAVAAERVLNVLPQAQGAAIELIEQGPGGQEQMVYRAVGGSLKPFLDMRVPRGASLSGLCTREGRPLVSDDCSSDPRVDAEGCRRTGIRSMVVVPIPRGGFIAGVLKLASGVPSAFHEADILAAQLAVGSIVTGLSDVAEARALGALRRSEAEFRQLADAMPQIVWAARSDGVLEYYNRQWSDYTRRPDADDPRNLPDADDPRAASEANRWAEFVHPDDLPAAAAAWAESLRTGEPYTVQFRLSRGDDTWRWFLVRALSVRDQTGTIVRWFGTCTDVQEQKATEAALRASQERFAIAVEAAELGTFHWTLPVTPETVYEWNDKLRELFWVPPGAVTSPRVREEAIDAADRDRVRTAIDRALAGLAKYDVEYLVHGPAGARRWLRAIGQTFGQSPATGQPEQFTGVVMDITQRRQDEEEREQLLAAERLARTEAERAGQMKDEFLATLSHELRTPLNAIVGWVQILRGGGANAEDVEEGLAIIDRNARAQTQIIEDILDMSRIISGKLRLDVQRVDLPALVRAGVDTVQPAADAKGVRLQVLLDPAAGPVSGDPNRLHQVFWNLLSNAVKFTPRGGRVQVLLERVDSRVEVSVTDTGEGIDPAFLPFVFDRFRQADASTTRRHGGLGLGLAIVKQLVELHGGSVQVKSSGPGKGSTFTVLLPLTVIHTPLEEPLPIREHPHAELQRGIERQNACGQLEGIDVMVVDDEPDGRAVVHRLLEECGAGVRTAGSAAEAMRLIAERVPQVLVSDIGMPGEDGYSLIRRIRSLPADKGAKIPAIALTAYARAADRMKAMEAGFQMHLAKPVEPAELVVTVAAVARTAVKESG